MRIQLFLLSGAATLLLQVSLATSACFPCSQCKKEGLMNRTAWFVTDRASCRLDDAIVDLRKYAKVCDLTCCPVGTHRAHYHRLVDCMVPSLLTLHKSLQLRDETKVAIIPNHLSDFYDVILRNTSSMERVLHEPSTTPCYIVSNNALVLNKEAESMNSPDLWNAIHASQAWAGFHETLQRGLGLESQPKAGRTSVAAVPKSAGTITLIRRPGRTRAFANAGEVVAALNAEFPNWNVQVFYGNETAARTMDMFAQSKVVIGYHGAGLANVLFSPPGTVVLEFTTMKDVGSRAVWRTNAVLEKIHPNLTWIQHAVDLDRLDHDSTGVGTFVDAVNAAQDRNHFIKSVKRVYISPGVLFNAFSRLKKEIPTLTT